MTSKIMRGIWLVLAVGFLPAQASAETLVEFLIDSSGSMEAPVGGVPKIGIAKQAVKSVLETIPPGTKVALRAYAHRIPKENKDQSCLDTELMVPFSPLDKATFSAKVDLLAPRGWTPIAFSLREAAKDFAAMREAQYVIILVSDGEETCGGDPVLEAKNLLGQGFKVVIHTVGFDVDEKTRAQLMSISTATGGQYADARDAASLTTSLQQMAQQALLIERQAMAVRGQEIRGGASFETCVPAPYDVETHLDHHQREDQYDYFCLDLKRGQTLTMTMATLEKGVEIKGDQFRENDNPAVGYRLMGPTFEQMATDYISYTRSAKRSRSLEVEKDGRYFFLFGRQGQAIHKDSSFLLHIEGHFDAGADRDAGGEITQALSIAPGEYPGNWFGSEDRSDFYSFSAPPGATFNFSAMPTENLEASIRFTLYDQDRVRVANEGAPNAGAAVRMGPITLSRGGLYSLEVEAYGVFKPTKYSLSVSPVGSIPVTAPVALPLPLTMPGMPPVAPFPSPVPFPVPPVTPPLPPTVEPPVTPPQEAAGVEEGGEEEVRRVRRLERRGEGRRGFSRAALAVIFLEALVIVGLVIVILIMVLKRGGKQG